MKCKPEYKFVVAGETIEIRKKDGSYDPDDKSCVSICCPECLPDLEEAILELKKKIGKGSQDPLELIIKTCQEQQKVISRLVAATAFLDLYKAILPEIFTAGRLSGQHGTGKVSYFIKHLAALRQEFDIAKTDEEFLDELNTKGMVVVELKPKKQPNNKEKKKNGKS